MAEKSDKSPRKAAAKPAAAKTTAPKPAASKPTATPKTATSKTTTTKAKVAAARKPATRRKTAPVTSEMIAERAYFIAVSGDGSSDFENWLRAEAELTSGAA